MRSTSLKLLSAILYFISLFHIIAGAGLMFSVEFQKFAANHYGAVTAWDVKSVYFTRILGSFVFVLGTLALAAARDPLKYRIIVIGFIEFFILRNINRHLYSNELYEAFGVSPLMNNLTTIFFGSQAILLGVLLWMSLKKSKASSLSHLG